VSSDLAPVQDAPLLSGRMRRMPAYESGDRLPAVPTRLWWRWYSWKAGRDGAHPCEARMAEHLTHFADEETGRITAVAAAIEVYAAHHLVSTRTAWTDRRRLMDRGLVREEVAPTYGRTAVYRLCVPVEALAELAQMPRSLAHAFARHFGLPISTGSDSGPCDEPQSSASGTVAGAESAQEAPEAGGRDEALGIDLGPVPRSPAFLHHHLSGCEVIRVGSATGPRRYSGASCGRLHLSPLPREIFSPSLRLQPSQRRKCRSAGGGIKITHRERAVAEELMRRCWRSWLLQRGGSPLRPAEWAGLVDVVAHAIRAADNPADVRDALTDRIGSARHLPTLLAYRARRIIAHGHRRAVVPPVRPEMIQARQRAAEAAQAGRAATDRAAATLAALRAELAAKQPPPATTAPADAVPPLVTTWTTEPEQPAPPPADATVADSRRRRALALARARRDRAAEKISGDRAVTGCAS
jgi:hypothetical protein